MADNLSEFDAPGAQVGARELSPDEFLKQFDAPEPPKPAAQPAVAKTSPAVPPAEGEDLTQLWKQKDPVAGLGAAALATGAYAGISGLTRTLNALRGKWDPDKARQMQTYEAMRDAGIPTRIGDLTGNTESARSIGQNPRWRSLENFTENYIPLSGADSMLDKQVEGLRPVVGEGSVVGDKTMDAMKRAWKNRESQVDQLWKDMDLIGQQSNLTNLIPDETVTQLQNFVRTYGPQKLASIPNKETAATLLTLAGYPEEAASAIGHLTPNQIKYRLNRANNMAGGTSFSAFRDLQKAIGQTIGSFAGMPGAPVPPEQSAFKAIYAATHRDLDNFGGDPSNTKFMEAYDAARQAAKDTHDFYDDNNFLRKVIAGRYDMTGPQFLRDFTNPSNAAKVSPLAPYVDPADVMSFQAPLVADRATKRLVGEALREPGNKHLIPKALTGALELGAATGPGLYGAWSPHASVIPALGMLAGQTAAANALNSRVAPRLWGASNPIGLDPVAESPVLGVLKKLGKARIRFP